jgi:hypothetical protein
MLLLSAHTLSKMPPVEYGCRTPARDVFCSVVGGLLPVLVCKMTKQALLLPVLGTQTAKQSAVSQTHSSGSSANRKGRVRDELLAMRQPLLDKQSNDACQVRSLLAARGIMDGCWRAIHRGHQTVASTGAVVRSELGQ